MKRLRPTHTKPGADLVALGGSALVHGVALAAIVALQGGPPKPAEPPAAIPVAIVWSAPAASPLETSATDEPTAPASTDMAEDDAATTQAAAAASENRSPKLKASAQPKITLREPPPRKPQDATRETDRSPTAASSVPDISAAASSQAAPAAGMPAGAPQASAPWSVTFRVPPAYPMSTRRRGIEGDVLLRVEVGPEGRPRAVTIGHSSGNPQLDSAALRAVEQWRFAVAAPMTIEVPVQFRLTANTAEAAAP